MLKVPDVPEALQYLANDIAYEFEIEWSASAYRITRVTREDHSLYMAP
jgi:hypothetical protein